MKLVSASLRWLLCGALTLQALACAAAELDPEMSAALHQLVDSQKLEETLPAVLDKARLQGIEQAKKGAEQAIADNRALSDTERAQARKIMDELAPQLVAGVDADLRKLDFQALAQGMVEAVYPKYYTVQEVRQLAAYYASPGYQKMMALLRKVQEEHARTGQDSQQLWRLHGKEISAEDKRTVADFLDSPLGKKQKAIGERAQDECAAYLRRQIAPAFAATAATHRRLFLEKLAQAQGQGR
jgi:hypothetical protein